MAELWVKSGLLCAALAAAISSATPAASASNCLRCGLTPGETSASATEQSPLELEVETQLNFDRIVLAGGGAGVATLKPDGDSQFGGAVESVGGKTMVGRVIIRGEPGRAILVDFPARLDLTSMSGGTISIEHVITDLPVNPSLDQSGQLIVNFGGELKIDGGVDGNFRGNLLIRADYL